jgi:hypothetical protein
MALNIEKRLAALESRTTNYNAVFRMMDGRVPTPKQAAEHAAIESSGAFLFVVQFITPPGTEQTAGSTTC